ncbi:MAG: hypothetical protein D6800_10790 [Candidatus Zixiibacteriota bacterium]|nr:MAG: hypothetical protein D6800_10790 [candidate division Zixibacteria bacterium]
MMLSTFEQIRFHREYTEAGEEPMKLCQENGISILEVMVAMVILGLGVLGLAPLVTISIYSNGFAGKLTAAEQIARRELEELVSQPTYGSLPFVAGPDSVGGRYLVTRKVDDNTTDASVPSGVYKLHVLLQWNDDVNRPRNIDMVTYKPIL